MIIAKVEPTLSGQDGLFQLFHLIFQTRDIYSIIEQVPQNADNSCHSGNGGGGVMVPSTKSTKSNCQH